MRRDPKFGRDPVTGYATVEIAGREIVLQKEVENPEEALTAPARTVVECGL